MIRRFYTALGQVVFFVIGSDKTLERFVDQANRLDGPARQYPVRPVPYSEEWYAERLAARASKRRRGLTRLLRRR